MSTTATMTATKSLTVLILGSTGEVGKQTLLSALASPSITSVHALGRSSPSIPTSTPGYSKLQSTVVDFEKLLSEDSIEKQKFSSVKADLILITLGTTKANAGSMEAFHRIDNDYVVKGSEAARISDKDQTLLYCSSGGASSSSLFPYLKSKGITEESLAKLGYSQTIIFRPGYLVVPGGRKEHRFFESAFGRVMNVAATLSDSLQIETPTLGKAIINAGIGGSKGYPTIGTNELLAGRSIWSLNNVDSLKLGKE